ncbi:sugar nucleotidyltransferase [Actinomarinicola tropica]|uniref:Glucose-1-phosphate thymidylyltransferase n=1 Tax=Actinomarinicola tropica TaxID=2789776 RepID=A0A5Q2RMR1_9ACTN|nr:sugar phosphate nucleotidyltransferase [Actinomarinicola tropica]QGG95861.1 NTP transferase domain-containing protein [Actinomarinicola tropica]
MKGIVLAGGRATRLGPASRGTSKQLMHVYDKPLVYYPISTLIHARINEILIISSPDQLPLYEALLGDGSQWGCRFEYAVQAEPRGLADAFIVGADFIGGDKVALILGDNLFYGYGLGEQLQTHTDPKGAVVFGLWAHDPHRYGVLELDAEGRVVGIHEKPEDPPSNLMVPGLYFYDSSVVDRARSLAPSPRGEIEITDLNAGYLADGLLEVCRLPFSTDWFDVGTFDAMLDAQTWVAGQQRRKGLLIGSPEAAAHREGFIDTEQLHRLAEAADHGGDLAKSGYAERLLRILDLEGERF